MLRYVSAICYAFSCILIWDLDKPCLGNHPYVNCYGKIVNK